MSKKALEFNAKDVIVVSKTGQVYLGGKLLTDTEITNLNAEVKYFKTLRLYDIFRNTVRGQAYLTMFEKSKTFEDMISGKAMLHAIGTLDSILNTVDKAARRIKK